MTINDHEVNKMKNWFKAISLALGLTMAASPVTTAYAKSRGGSTGTANSIGNLETRGGGNVTYKKQKAQDTWDRYIADLRQRYRRLPALKDELNRAGL